MYRATTAPVVEQALLDALLSAIKTLPAGVLIPTPHVELYTNAVNLTGLDAYASFTLATFSGYAPAVVTWQTSGNLLNGDQGLPAQVAFAASGAGTIADSVKGYIVTDGVSKVFQAENFAQPVAFGTVGDFLNLDVLVVLKMRPTFATS